MFIFSSLIFLNHGDSSLHTKLHNDCINFIKLHSLYFEKIFENIDTYLNNLSKPNPWGGEIEIFCLSEIY